MISEKEKRINAEVKRLTKIFKNIDADKRGTCLNMIQNAAFISSTLQDIQKSINESGVVDTYDNGGGQSGSRISPATQAYTKLIGNYNSIIKQLVALLPSGDKDMARISADPMASFLNE